MEINNRHLKISNDVNGVDYACVNNATYIRILPNFWRKRNTSEIYLVVPNLGEMLRNSTT